MSNALINDFYRWIHVMNAFMENDFTFDLKTKIRASRFISL